MKHFLIIISVVFIIAASGWWCYGIFESDTMSLSEKHAMSSLVALFGFMLAFIMGVFIKQQYPFK